MAGALRVGGLTPVYALSEGKTLPEFLNERERRRLLQKDDEIRRRITLLQDLEFENGTSQNLKFSGDGKFLVVTGAYPPRCKVFELAQLGMKFERRLDSECVDVCGLTSDLGKMAFLLSDRTIDFHTPFGTHYKLRVPTHGRELFYDDVRCTLRIGGAKGQIFGIDLEAGKFLEPLVVSDDQNVRLRHVGVNRMQLAPGMPLLAGGCDDGTTRFWDLRSNGPVAVLDNKNAEVTSLAFQDGPGVPFLATGDADATVQIYDLRSSRPTATKEHQYGLPIVDVKFFKSHIGGGSSLLLSADPRIIKAWRATNGEVVANVETASEITRIAVAPAGFRMDPLLTNAQKKAQRIARQRREADDFTPRDRHQQYQADDDSLRPMTDSGLLLCAGEQPKVMAYYVPILGPAPPWCSFLDSFTEELEEAEPTAFDDFRFVSKTELADVDASHLVGTPHVRAYMHGFMIDAKLYRKLRAIAQPFEYDEYKKLQAEKKLKADRGLTKILERKRSRHLPKVNTKFAKRLLEKDEDQDLRNPLGDDRFQALFQDKNFQIDELAPEYLARHPNAPNQQQRQDDSVDDSDDSDDSDAGVSTTTNGHRRVVVSAQTGLDAAAALGLADDRDDDDDEATKSKRSVALGKRIADERRDDLLDATAFSSRILGTTDNDDGVVKEITFIPKSDLQQQQRGRPPPPQKDGRPSGGGGGKKKKKTRRK